MMQINNKLSRTCVSNLKENVNESGLCNPRTAIYEGGPTGPRTESHSYQFRASFLVAWNWDEAQGKIVRDLALADLPTSFVGCSTLIPKGHLGTHLLKGTLSPVFATPSGEYKPSCAGRRY
jgi:hypothetical protein